MKAQSNVEFLVILAGAMVILLAITLLSGDHISGMSSMRERSDARNTVLDLSAAAKDVYSQGIGARKQVHVVIPSSYQANESYVSSNAIKLRARGSDYLAVEDFEVYGSLPSASGPQWIWVISEGQKVRIGTPMLSLSQNSIYLVMKRGASISTSIDAENVWHEDIDVDVDLTWMHADVAMSAAPSAFALTPGEESTVGIGFSANNESLGFYNGEIAFRATDGTENETVKVPVTVEVVAFVSAPPLLVFPPVWNESLQAGETAMRTFTVCTNEVTSPSGVTFTPSGVSPGGWVGGNTPLGPMDESSCQTKTLHLTVPPGTEAGLYTGTIVVRGLGYAKAEDTISLIVLVGGDPDDAIGPIVTDIFHLPTKVYTGQSVIFVVEGSDKYRGNNTIKLCEANMGNGTWVEMEPLDGMFNSMTERARMTHYPGFPLIGDHNVSFRCTDYNDNVGPPANYTLRAMKNFLFITKGSTPASGEQVWLDWMDTHNSTQGYSWEYDMIPNDDFYNDVVDKTYYSAALMADYQFPADLATSLQQYITMGGKVVFLGSALDQGPRDFGQTSEPGTQGSSDTAYVITNLHYATWDYSSGDTITVFSPSGSSRAVKSSYIGTKLISADATQSEIMLGDYQGTLIWGPKTPEDLSADGETITSNLLDYSLLSSTITPG